jgi:hypothetical protein
MLQPSPLESVRHTPRRFTWRIAAAALVSIAAAHEAAAQRGAPTIAQAERAIDAKLQHLKPDGMTERNVLFQSGRAGSGSGGSYPYRVTMLVRDYGPGYPANHFYGETCVARFDEETFTLEPDGFGGWNVSGRFTPDLSSRKCTRNPSAGVSSVPLAGLSGTSVAGAGAAADAAAAASAAQPAAGAATPAASSSAADGGVTAGAYDCWANGEARPLMNFTVRAGGRYVGADGKAGTYRLDAATQRITFSGGALDGVMPSGFSAIYHLAQGRPTVSFRGRGGGEAAFCEHR